MKFVIVSLKNVNCFSGIALQFIKFILKPRGRYPPILHGHYALLRTLVSRARIQFPILRMRQCVERQAIYLSGFQVLIFTLFGYGVRNEK